MGSLLTLVAPISAELSERLPASAPDAVVERTQPVAEAATAEPRATDVRWTSLAVSMARAVRRQCPAWLSAHADDIVQAALTKVMAADRRGEGERTLTSFYLHRVAHSALVDEIRRWKRRSEVPLDTTSADGEPPRGYEPVAQGDPESGASYRELGRAVRESLAELTRERRLAVTLHLQGHSVPEAARLLGWDEKRTENLVYRGLANLRTSLIRKGYTP